MTESFQKAWLFQIDSITKKDARRISESRNRSMISAKRDRFAGRRRPRANSHRVFAPGLRICELSSQNAKYFKQYRNACGLMKSGNPVIKAAAISEAGPTLPT